MLLYRYTIGWGDVTWKLTSNDFRVYIPNSETSYQGNSTLLNKAQFNGSCLKKGEYMNSRDFKKLYEYINNDNEVYIITKGLKFNPITDVRKTIIAEIDKLSPQSYLRISSNITKNGCSQINSIRMDKRFNSYLINISNLKPILDYLGLDIKSLLNSKDIFVKKRKSIDASVEKKVLSKEKEKSKIKVTADNRVDDNFKKWIKSTRNDLYKNETNGEKAAYKKLYSAFGKRVKIQHPFVIKGKSYFADICIKSKKLIIEVDGGYHNTEEQITKDKKRDEAFASIGYTTIRITNNQAMDKKFMQEMVKNIKESKSKNLIVGSSV